MDIIERLKDSSTKQKSNSKLLAKAKVFNPFSSEFQYNPYPTYHQLRQEDPIHMSFMGVWVLTRYDDISQVLQDSRFGAPHFNYSSINFDSKSKSTENNQILNQFCDNLILCHDPPRHTQIKRTLTQAFNLYSMNAISLKIRTIVNDLFTEIEGKDEIDIIKGLAHPLPIRLMAEFIGIPEVDLEKLENWSKKSSCLIESMSSAAQKEELMESIAEFRDYMKYLIKQKRNNPQCDFISKLVELNNRDKQLSEEELITSCIFLFPAGEKTTSSQISNCILGLLLFPAQMRKLRTQQSLLPKAVDELIRYDSAIQIISRTALEDIQFRQTKIYKNQKVLLVLGSGNRDSHQFFEPDRVEITRKENKHLSFSSGIHHCWGAHLARLEIQITLEILLQKMKNIKLLTNKLEWQESMSLRSLKSLPVTFNTVK